MSHRFSTVSMLLNTVLLLSGSTNPTAGLAAPVGSKYWRSGTAGDYTKTGSGNGDWTIAPTGIYFNVLDYGADPSGVTDTRAAIQLAITDASVIGGTVYFPPGTYKIGKSGANPYSFVFNNVDNVRFLGCGWGGSVLKMSGSAGAGAWNMFRLTGGSEGIEWEGMTFDQSGLTSPGADVDHLINIVEASNTKILNCRFTGGVATAGAYVHVGGTSGLVAEKTWIVGCRMDAAGGPCVWFDSESTKGWLVDSTLVNSADDDCLVIDDVASGDISDIKVMGNHIEGSQKWAVRCTSPTLLQRLQINGNLILGLVSMTLATRSQFQNNEVYFSTAVHTAAVCDFISCGEFQFQDNIIGRTSACAVGRLAKWTTCTGIQQHGNHFIQEKAGSGLWHTFDTTEFQSLGNTSKVSDAGSSTVNACIVESSAVNIAGIQISDQVSADAGTWLRSIHVLAGATTISNVQVNGGIHRNNATGVEFDGVAARFPAFLQVSGGIISSSTAAIVMASGVYVRVGGNAGTFGVNGIMGSGTPEGNVTARIGSYYHRTDVAPALYVKETGTGNTGWVAK